jgi:NADH-quinone oxidoreductase subunit E
MCECSRKKSDLSLLSGVLEEYAKVEGSLITILQKAQEIYGYLPIDVIYHIAEATGNSPAKVLGVATFYTQFRLQPVGKYLIMLCQGTACHVNGSERILAAISEELGIVNGETTEDGIFTLSNVACLGCCSLSPVMMINGETYGTLTPDKAIGILRELRERAGKEATA